MFDHNLIYQKMLNGVFSQIVQNRIRQIDCWEYLDQVYYCPIFLTIYLELKVKLQFITK